MILKENNIDNFITANNQPNEMPLIGIPATSMNYKDLLISSVGVNFGAIGGAIAGSTVGRGVVQCIFLANNIRFVIGFINTKG